MPRVGVGECQKKPLQHMDDGNHSALKIEVKSRKDQTATARPWCVSSTFSLSSESVLSGSDISTSRILQSNDSEAQPVYIDSSSLIIAVLHTRYFRFWGA